MPTYRNPREAARALKSWFDAEDLRQVSEAKQSEMPETASRYPANRLGKDLNPEAYKGIPDGYAPGPVPEADQYETFQYDNQGCYKLGSDPERELLNRAAAIYGETSGLYPQRIDPAGGIYNQQNLDPRSASELANVRRDVGLISERNRHIHFKVPTDFNNPIQKAAWESALQAAAAGGDNQGALDPRLTNIMFVPNKDGKTAESVWGQGIVAETPTFYNVGGGDVLKGPAHIQFWGPRRK